MIPSEITAEHVHAAIAEIDRTGVPEWRQSTRYLLVYQGRCYPPKYVVSLAARHATGRALRSNEFNGGSETNTFLRSLGFQITRRAAERVPDGPVLRPATRLVPADPDLATVIDAWDRLSEAVRAGIVAMVKAAAKVGGR
jgi:hypothetical protein